MDHQFIICADANLELIGQCISDLTQACGQRLWTDEIQRSVIAREMRVSLSRAQIRLDAQNRLRAQEIALAQWELGEFRERVRREAARQLLREENDYEDNDVIIETDSDEDVSEGE
ncbi:uncharacterized protein RCC_09591 [Ramularia collo-cygni]|uniref:Uncharacterized protein n=1 Tax=Ramularia collo-cygni TaxID=112498 RepID=A0A2D3V3C9_9PEZI|nr:uncharacterized protein RCC_09591 [Ramularia collo-cygni]CZT23876.1 uncharacterized protein RCC_09591 [Ramularia collo-cygni]